MRTNRKKAIKLFILILILILGIGYAALTTTLKINGTVDVSKATWDVHFENVNITNGSVTANPAPTSNNIDTIEMTYTINFTKPGDFFEFTVDVVNDGTIDAMIDVVSNKTYSSNGTTEITLPTYLTSTTTYEDGTPIAQNQKLVHETSEKIKVRVEFKKDIQASDLPSSGDTTVVFKFSGNFKQADENSVPRVVYSTIGDGTNEDGVITTVSEGRLERPNDKFAYLKYKPTNVNITSENIPEACIYSSDYSGELCLKSNDYENAKKKIMEYFGEGCTERTYGSVNTVSCGGGIPYVYFNAYSTGSIEAGFSDYVCSGIDSMHCTLY